MSLRFLEKFNDLLARDAGESVEKIIDRITALEMIEQAFCRNTSPDENRLTPKNFGIAMNDFAHA